MKSKLFFLSVLLLISGFSKAQNRLRNLGGYINSYRSEISPYISPDGKTLYYSRSDPSDRENKSRNIRKSSLRSNGYWSRSKEVDDVINNDGWNAVCGMTYSGDSLLLAGSYMPDGTLKGGFSITRRLPGGGWSTPVSIIIEEFPQDYETQTASMSYNGKVIVFSTNTRFEEHHGMFDLFVIQQKEDGTWTKPMNLGETINTSNYETAPFIASDGVTLYFAANRDDGFGGHDIYVTRRLDDSWQKWTEPQNLGAEVNTSYWESYISVTATMDYAYIGSTKPGYGRMDLYRVKLKRELKPFHEIPVDVADVPRLMKNFPDINEINEELTGIKESHNAEKDRKEKVKTVNEKEESKKVEKETKKVVKKNIEKEKTAPKKLPGGTQKLENLGGNVNSYMSEMAPLISPDGQTLFFSRSVPGDWQNKNRDIYYASIKSNSWENAKNIGPAVNTPGWNIPCGITPDGNTLLVTGYYLPDGQLRGGFSKSYKTARGWSIPEPLEIKNFPKHEDIQSGTMSADGKVIIFASRTNISGEFYGTVDLYVTFEKNDGTWTTPANLGEEINTPGYETSPFLAADGISLYFSTNGHGGYGSQDIYVSKRMDETWQKWSIPKNLGPRVNSNAWESYFAISAAGDYAYVGSRKNTLGRMDIFRIQVDSSMKVKPEPMVIVSGKVLDITNSQPLEAEIIYESLTDSSFHGKARTNPATGEFKIALNKGDKYGFFATAIGYFGENQNINLTELEAYQEVKQNLYLAPVKEGQIVRMNNVFFKQSLPKLLPESYPELKRVAAFLKANPDIIIEVGGHTDNRGRDDELRRLSRQRAYMVRNFLISTGIDSDRIKAYGYGKDFPVESNQTEEGRKKNRRVEFKIIKRKK